MILTDSESLLRHPSLIPPIERRFRRLTGARSRTRRRRSLRPLWMAWHLLSLDAATIAALWSRLMAQAVHVRLPWAETVVLAGAVWLTYTADRILDGSISPDPERLRLRHRFASRQRSRLIPAWLLVLAGVGWLSLCGIDRLVYRAGLPVLAVVAGYLCLVHLGRRLLFADWIKRSLVATVFSTGSLLPAWIHASEPRRLIVPGLAFAGICFLNCTAIETWEGDQRPRGFGLMMLASAGVYAVLCASPFAAGERTVLGACTVSACGLILLDRVQALWSAEAVRVLADVALLTAAVALCRG